MRVIVTRPAKDAARWAERLRARGIDAVALPLLAIGPPLATEPLAAAWRSLPHYAAAMFVSANAVHGFFASRSGAAWPPGLRAWAPGPGTREALTAAGIGGGAIDAPAPDAAQFDSEALWHQVAGQLRAGDRLLLVRGSDAHGQSQGRDWISQRLQDAGVTVDTVIAYARLAPSWDAAHVALARRSAADGSLWLFSSSEAVAQLGRILPEVDWRPAQALATHPRIAQAVRALGFGGVRESRPDFDEVVASIESAR
jgi:uroporphyrinogen-III synthase